MASRGRASRAGTTVVNTGRRPIRAFERPHLARLGRYLSGLRRTAGLTQDELALAAGLTRVHVSRIETGARRTRRSTLHRIACVLVVDNPELGPVDVLLEDMVALAGPALAEESAYRERVGRRRGPRSDKAWREEERQQWDSTVGYLHDVSHGRYARWRPEGELDEIREVIWDYHYQRRDEREERRRGIERLQRRST